MEKPGYHLVEIKKGKIGTSSKIREELEELEDAEMQGAKIMCLVELSDMLGAIEAYLELQAPGTTMEDLLHMSRITQRAFKNGKRQ